MANGNYPERSNRKRTASYVLFGISALLILLLCITPSRRFVYGLFGYAVYAYLPMMVLSAVLLFSGRAPAVKPARFVLYIALFIMAVATLHIGLSAELLTESNYLSATYASNTVGGVTIGLISALLKLICVDDYAWMLAVSFVITALLGLVAIYPLIAVWSERKGGSSKNKKPASPALRARYGAREVTTRSRSDKVITNTGDREREQEVVSSVPESPQNIYNLTGTQGTHTPILDESVAPQYPKYKGRGAELLFGNEPYYDDEKPERKSSSPYATLDSLGQDKINRAITNQERLRLFNANLGPKSDEEEYNERFGNGKLDGQYATPRASDPMVQYGAPTERVVPDARGLYETPRNSDTYEPSVTPQTPSYAETTRADIIQNPYARPTVNAENEADQKDSGRVVTDIPKDRASMLDYITRPVTTAEYENMDLFRELPSERATKRQSEQAPTTVVEPAPVKVQEPVVPTKAEERRYSSYDEAPAPVLPERNEVAPAKPVYKSEAMRKETEPELAKQARQTERAERTPVKTEEAPAPAEKKPYVPKPYVAPPYELLRDYGDGCGTFPPDYEEVKSKLEMTMEEFNVPATVEKAVRGPSFTMYYLKLGPGYKINKITSLKENLKMRLMVKNLRILAPIEGCDNFGIELPNSKRDKVGLRSILCSKEFNEKNSGIQIAFGKTLDGTAYVADLAKMPHLLVAGATGTGKSVFLNSLITSILFKYSPEDVRMILIDPKRVELSVYRGLPNLLIKETIKEAKHAVNVLKWLTQEMDRRYAFFEEKGCANIDQYNTLYRQPDEPKMYRIVLIVDEMADLMMKSKDNTVEECIVRIAQLARACGIHMVIATQRPIVKVITGLIKGNILHRVAFTVKSNQDSRVILDDGGAEELLGLGDMLYSFPSNLVRIQGALVEIDEIKAVCDFIRANNEGDFDEEIVKVVTYEPPKPETAEEKSQAREEERDADFERLLRKILKSFILEQRASVSSAQASHHVGYIKARKLLDAMTERGFLSKGDGAKPRDILITLDEYYEIFGKDDDADINTTEDDSTDDE